MLLKLAFFFLSFLFLFGPILGTTYNIEIETNPHPRPHLPPSAVTTPPTETQPPETTSTSTQTEPQTTSIATETPVPEESSTGTSADAVNKFLANKIWDCKTNGQFCPNLDKFYAPVRECAYDDMGWICRPGTYEALNGSCLHNDNCKRDDNSDRVLCIGCNLEDRPAEGPTVLDCAQKEINCFHLLDLKRVLMKMSCMEHEKRHICKFGYHRTFPDNKCVENWGEIYGCEIVYAHICPPNTPDKCLNGITGTPVGNPLYALFVNRIWGCKANNRFCTNFDKNFTPVRECAYEDMGWICRPDTYEALNGSCLYNYNCKRDDNSNRVLCIGCNLEDRPAEGPTVVDCVQREKSCFHAKEEYLNCADYEKRHICAPGYHRVFPDNKCVDNHNIHGCETILTHRCPPNTPGNCPNGIIPDETTKKPSRQTTQPQTTITIEPETEPQTLPQETSTTQSQTTSASTETPVPEESSTVTPPVDPLDAYFADRIWGCKANNVFCPNLVQKNTPVRECAYEEMGWICRPGTYETLNGLCFINHYCIDQSNCNGCRYVTIPEIGPTVFDCVEKEETCFPYDAERAANVECEVWQKKRICAPGYHRVFPDKCVENGNSSLDIFYAKPGCKDFLLRTCPPNTHGICTSGIVPGEPYCGYTSVNNPAGPEPQLRSQLGDDQPEDDLCGVVCQCNEGFVRASSDMHSECIPTAECEARLHPKCRSKNEEFYRCPKRFDIDCPLLVNIDKDCGIQENLWVSTNSSCSVEEVGEMNCLGPANCLCKPGYVRLKGKCVDIQECAEYRKQHPIEVDVGGRATGTIDGANRYLEAKKGK